MQGKMDVQGAHPGGATILARPAKPVVQTS